MIRWVGVLPSVVTLEAFKSDELVSSKVCKVCLDHSTLGGGQVAMPSILHIYVLLIHYSGKQALTRLVNDPTIKTIIFFSVLGGFFRLWNVVGGIDITPGPLMFIIYIYMAFVNRFKQLFLNTWQNWFMTIYLYI